MFHPLSGTDEARIADEILGVFLNHFKKGKDQKIPDGVNIVDQADDFLS